MQPPNATSGTPSISRARVAVGIVLTGTTSVAIAMVAWVLLVGQLDNRLSSNNHLLWTATLWSSALLSAAFVAYCSRSVRPVLACTVAFGIFGLVYMACEGPLFGDVSQGGDPAITKLVVTNLVSLPLGVFFASEFGCWLRTRISLKRVETT